MEREKLSLEYQRHILFKEHVRTLVDALREISPENLIPQSGSGKAGGLYEDELKRIKNEWTETYLEFCKKIREMGVKYPIHVILGIKDPEIEESEKGSAGQKSS